MKINTLFKEIKDIKTFIFGDKNYPVAVAINDDYIVLSKKKLIAQ